MRIVICQNFIHRLAACAAVPQTAAAHTPVLFFFTVVARLQAEAGLLMRALLYRRVSCSLSVDRLIIRIEEIKNLYQPVLYNVKIQAKKIQLPRKIEIVIGQPFMKFDLYFQIHQRGNQSKCAKNTSLIGNNYGNLD